MTFEEFAGTRMQPLLRFAKVLCGDRALAEDVLQEVLIRAHARRSRIADTQSPEAYVRKMIVNEYLSWCRSPRSWGRVVPLPTVQPRDVVPDLADQHADRDALVADLARLAPQQRAVLVLRYYRRERDPGREPRRRLQRRGQPGSPRAREPRPRPRGQGSFRPHADGPLFPASRRRSRVVRCRRRRYVRIGPSALEQAHIVERREGF